MELVLAFPLLVLVLAAVWQAALAGQAAWLAGGAARAAARAQAVGADGAGAARAALPARLRGGLRVRTRPDGGVEVGVRVPAVLGGARLATIAASARFAPQRP